MTSAANAAGPAAGGRREAAAAVSTRVERAARERDVGAGLGQGGGHRLAQAARAASHQGDLAVEPEAIEDGRDAWASVRALYSVRAEIRLARKSLSDPSCRRGIRHDAPQAHRAGRGVAVGGAVLAAQTRTSDAPLEIYVVDTEGGKATLFISPSGESLLIDSGNPGGRDTDRILTLLSQIGLKQIDYLRLHALSRRSHRRNDRARQAHSDPSFPGSRADGRREGTGTGIPGRVRRALRQAKHTVVKPGDRVPITGLDWRIVTAGGEGAEGAAAGRRAAECGLRAVEAEREYAGSRERPVSRQSGHATGSSARSISAICSGTTRSN